MFPFWDIQDPCLLFCFHLVNFIAQHGCMSCWVHISHGKSSTFSSHNVTEPPASACDVGHSTSKRHRNHRDTDKAGIFWLKIRVFYSFTSEISLKCFRWHSLNPPSYWYPTMPLQQKQNAPLGSAGNILQADRRSSKYSDAGDTASNFRPIQRGAFASWQILQDSLVNYMTWLLWGSFQLSGPWDDFYVILGSSMNLWSRDIY